VNYLKAAFLMPGNLFALAVSGAVVAYYGQAWPALIAVAAEALYLAAVSAAPPFRRAVRARQSGALDGPQEQVAALLEELAPSQRENYFALRDLRDKILGNYRKLPGGRVLAASSQHHVDALLTSFLRLLSTLNNYRKYLNASDKKGVERELGELKAEADQEQNPRLREVKLRRVDILGRRLQRYLQAEESRELISHQLASIEDLLRLTHEQSIAIRDPESVNRQLESLHAETASTEQSVREMERFMEFDEVLAPALTHGPRVR